MQFKLWLENEDLDQNKVFEFFLQVKKYLNSSKWYNFPETHKNSVREACQQDGFQLKEKLDSMSEFIELADKRLLGVDPSGNGGNGGFDNPLGINPQLSWWRDYALRRHIKIARPLLTSNKYKQYYLPMIVEIIEPNAEEIKYSGDEFGYK